MDFDDEKVDKIWEKATVVKGFDKDLIRKDSCEAWIMRDAYGNRNAVYGWEIDHVCPQSSGGDDKMENLRPLHWKNNVSKGDDYPTYFAAVTARENENVEVKIQRTVNPKLQQKLKELYDL